MENLEGWIVRNEPQMAAIRLSTTRMHRHQRGMRVKVTVFFVI